MSESTCIEHERANCATCERNAAVIKRAIAKRAFAEGFARGADPDHARKRHVVDPAMDAHWRAGFKVGVEAARKALDEYVRNEGLR